MPACSKNGMITQSPQIVWYSRITSEVRFSVTTITREDASNHVFTRGMFRNQIGEIATRRVRVKAEETPDVE